MVTMTTPADVVKVLECNLNLLEITLLGENISPSGSMEIEQNVEMIKLMIKKLKALPRNTFDAPPQPATPTKTPAPAPRVNLFKREKSDKKVETEFEDPPSEVIKRVEQAEDEHYEVDGGNPEVESCSGGPIIDEETYEISNDLIVNEDVYEIALEGGGSDSSSLPRTSSLMNRQLSTDELRAMLRKYQDMKPEELKRVATYEGQLQKHKKNRLLGQWHRRYCILKDAFLFYYKTENTNKEQGVIILSSYQFVLPSKDKNFTFNLNPTDGSKDGYTFQADTMEELEKWKFYLSAVTTVSEGDRNRGISIASNTSQNNESTDSGSAKGALIEDDKRTIEEADDEEGETYEVFPYNKSVADENDVANDFSMDNIYMGLYDCTGDEVNDLTFKTGDILYILNRLDTQWWFGYLNGKCGYVPVNYLTEAFN